MDAVTRTALLALLTEVFEGIEGEGTWFVDTLPNQGFFGMTDVPAEVASWAPGAGLNSIAAHTVHIRFALRLANAYARGEQPAHDWEGSWKIQQVDAAEWAEIRKTLRDEYQEMKGHLAKVEITDADTLTGALAMVPHVAWHLGAVKHIRAFCPVNDRG
jgi:hypothetical protein